ncbi:hypothetical protein WUBG_07123, partial [Wuchereria bancrofti]
MLIVLTFLHILLLWNVTNSLECYTGFSVIRGQTVGTTKEICSKQSDSCYRAMANVNLLSTVKKLDVLLYVVILIKTNASSRTYSVLKQCSAAVTIEICATLLRY